MQDDRQTLRPRLEQRDNSD